MNQGFDDEIMETEAEREDVIILNEKKKKPFAFWEVGGREYKMKLNTAAICRLEDKFKTSLLNLLFTSESVPPLSVMLTITQAAMQPWEHKMKYQDVQDLFDQYCDEGGTQMTFMTDVFMEIYKVSGFFTADQTEELDQKIETAKDLM